MNRAYVIMLLILMVPLAACMAPSRPIDNGYFAAEGVVIAAEDGSFSLKGSSAFKPPFQVDFFEWSDRSCEEFLQTRDDVRNAYKTALAMGAKRVKVTVPGMPNPLYGVLMLNMTKRNCSGPASRAYRIEIPKQYLDAATQGRVSVVYEQMPCDFGLKLKPSFSSECGIVKDVWYSWILWLSDQPFR